MFLTCQLILKNMLDRYTGWIIVPETEHLEDTFLQIISKSSCHYSYKKETFLQAFLLIYSPIFCT